MTEESGLVVLVLVHACNPSNSLERQRQEHHKFQASQKAYVKKKKEKKEKVGGHRDKGEAQGEGDQLAPPPPQPVKPLCRILPPPWAS